MSLTSSQDYSSIGVTNHPYLVTSSIGVTNHPVYYSMSPSPAWPLQGLLSMSIKHGPFNCPLARPSSGDPPTPPPNTYARKGDNKLLPICTYHGINTRYMKGYTARLDPQWVQTPPAAKRTSNQTPLPPQMYKSTKEKRNIPPQSSCTGVLQVGQGRKRVSMTSRGTTLTQARKSLVATNPTSYLSFNY